VKQVVVVVSIAVGRLVQLCCSVFVFQFSVVAISFSWRKTFLVDSKMTGQTHEFSLRDEGN